MRKVNRLHYEKEAARILAELQSKTEDERLMDFPRQSLNNENNMGEGQNFREFQERLEQSRWPWPWPYHTFPFPPFNTGPIGYPNWPPSQKYWFPHSPSYMPDTTTNPYMQGFSGMKYPPNWQILPNQQGKIS